MASTRTFFYFFLSGTVLLGLTGHAAKEGATYSPLLTITWEGGGVYPHKIY